MFIQVRAQNAASDGRSRAGRRFENGTVYRMEVIDGPGPDGKPLEVTAFAPDMTKVSRAGYELILKDPVMSVYERDDSAVDPQAGAVIGEAKVQIAELQAALTNARLELAGQGKVLEATEKKAHDVVAVAQKLEAELAQRDAEEGRGRDAYVALGKLLDAANARIAELEAEAKKAAEKPKAK